MQCRLLPELLGDLERRITCCDSILHFSFSPLLHLEIILANYSFTDIVEHDILCDPNGVVFLGV